MTLNIQNLKSVFEKLTEPSLPDWLKDHRMNGLNRFQKQGIPTTKNEEWKYTNLSALAKNTYALTETTHSVDLNAFKNYHGEDINIVFVNGILSHELSSFDNIPSKGVQILSLEGAMAENALSLTDLGTQFNAFHADPFIALNDALAHNGVFIKINTQLKASQLIHLIHVTTPEKNPVLSVPRTIIRLENSAEAHILESYVNVSNDCSYLTTPLTDIFLNENSTLYHGKSQIENTLAIHIGTTRVWQERNSILDSFVLTIGGKLVRNNMDVILAGEGAQTTLNGLYTIGHDQHVDNHTSIEHRAPHCTSHQLYKGILKDSARAVFNGKILVQPEAQQTNSYQLNKNLLLGKNCRIDTKPQLDIFADDVKCSHGATIGQLNEDELFYLQTRCISKQDAIHILARGFIDDVLNTIKSKKIHNKLQCKIPY